MRYLLHIVDMDNWSRVDRIYTPDSLSNEDFIHCSTRDQVLIPANALFRGRKDLLLLVIDTTLVTAPIRFEDCYESGVEFPHIYGPLNTNAVVDKIPFPPNADGTFALPAAVDSFLPPS